MRHLARRWLPAAFSIAATVAPALAQDAVSVAPAGRLLDGWLSELLDLDSAAAKAAYGEVAATQGVSRMVRGISLARSIEIARLEGDLALARELLERSTPERDDTRVQQPLEKDLLEGLRQRPPDTATEAVDQWRAEVRRQLHQASTFSPGRTMRSETRWLLARIADRVDVSDDERAQARRLRTQLAEASRDRDQARVEELRQRQTTDQRTQKRLGLQMLDLRLRGADRAAARLARASFVPPAPTLAVADADLETAVDRLQQSLDLELRGGSRFEQEILLRLRAHVERLSDAGDRRAALEIVNGVPHYARVLIALPDK